MSEAENGPPQPLTSGDVDALLDMVAQDAFLAERCRALMIRGGDAAPKRMLEVLATGEGRVVTGARTLLPLLRPQIAAYVVERTLTIEDAGLESFTRELSPQHDIVLPALAGHLAGAGDAHRRRILRMLAAFEPKEVQQALFSAYLQEDASEGRVVLLDALGALDPTGAAQMFLRAMKSDDRAILREGLKHLGPAAIRPLAAALCESPEAPFLELVPILEASGAEGVAALLEVIPGARPAAVEVLRGLVRKVGAAAAVPLAMALGRPEEVRNEGWASYPLDILLESLLVELGTESQAVLLTILEAEVPAARAGAVHVLSRIGWPEGQVEFRDLLQDPAYVVRAAVLEALTKSEDVPVTEALRDVLGSEFSDLRAGAAKALGKRRDVASVPALVALLGDPQSMVRTPAAEALGRMGPAAVVPLVEFLDAAPAQEVLPAVSALGELRDPAAIAPLLRVLRRDPARVQVHVLAALEAIGAPAVPALIEILEGEGDLVGQIAIDTLARVGDRRAIRPLLKHYRAHSGLDRAATVKALTGIHAYLSTFQVGTDLMDRGLYSEALGYFEEILRARPGWPAAVNNAGVCQYHLGQYEKAEELFRAVDVAPSRHRKGGSLNLGATRARRGDAHQAEVHTERALALDPAFPEAMYNMGWLARSAGRTDAALAWFGKAVKARRGYLRAGISEALVRAELGQIGEALRQLKGLARKARKTALEELVKQNLALLGGKR
ncbi:MAG: HEAT repeat domain-containing protein [Pseudomonadota bacterium]